MPEVLETPQQPVFASSFNPFEESTWKEASALTPPVQEAAQPITPTPAAEVIVPEVAPPNEEIFDESAYLKSKFGYEKPDDLLKELTELRIAKEKGFEFANDESRRVFEYIKENKEDELYSVLDQKRRVDRLLKADLSDKSAAAELIKLNYKTENKDLTDAEVDFLFKKRFGTPATPVQSLDESDEEFTNRKSSWEETVKEKEMEMSIEAKVAKPKLEKLKAELVLPDIKRAEPQQSNDQSPEEVAKYEKARERYLKGIDSVFEKFSGFNMTYKSEAGDIPISYVTNEEQKGAFKQSMSDFDLGKMIQERWFPEEENPNFGLLTEDVYFLRNKEAILQKVASESYAKGFANYLKNKSNINIQTPQQTFTPENTTTDREKQIDYIWKNS